MTMIDATTPTRKTPLVRGKYTNVLRQETNVAILDPDVVEQFPDSESVNIALRAFLTLRNDYEHWRVHTPGAKARF